VKLRILFAAALVLPAIGLVAASDPPAGLVVHEWGTFLAMNGSDGVTLDGMYHEEHALPAFVHSRSRDQLRLRQSNMKGETPVIYFYTQKPASVYVHVGFPRGLWTQWYPQASMVGPGLVQAGTSLRNGRIDWNLDIVPAAQAKPALPATTADALWNHARDVDAAYVTTSSRAGGPREWERFIFYRGLGEARMPLEAQLSHGRLKAKTSEPAGLHHFFVLRVENGRGTYTYTPALSAGGALDQPVPDMSGALPLDEFVARVSADVAARLVERGLYDKEARAMVNTWNSSYFKTDGVRVLFVLPQSWTDEFIPIRIDPKPAQLVRVMVGRVELLDEKRERDAESAIRDLAAPDAAVREKAFAALRGEGRYVEPIVRRTLSTTTDERVRTLARRLLLTDFVTSLRTALTHAETGERVLSDPVFVRAQLASLLREVGLTAEAKQEGEAALAQLERMPQPTMSEHPSRHMYRALARAYEGAGNDAKALNSYGEFIAFGSQNLGTCGGVCHAALSDAPHDMSFFRDWYAGRKFAEYAQKTGDAPRLIAAHEDTLARSAGSTAVKLQLAYLYEARGDTEKYRSLWKLIDP
jgi:tetratricopeptide (TPR) repeat protein